MSRYYKIRREQVESKPDIERKAQTKKFAVGGLITPKKKPLISKTD
jgi:hypothetical protein